MKGVKGILFVLAVVIAVLASIAGAMAAKGFDSYCAGYGEDECVQNYHWFSLDQCKTEIACVPIFSDYNYYTDQSGTIVQDVHVFKYKDFDKCLTMFRYNYSNCNRYPTEYCYNWEPVDIDNPVNCSCDRGQRFRKLDVCGNPTEEFSECINMASCEEKEVMPFTHIPATVHVNCTYFKRNCINPETTYSCRKKAERKRTCVDMKTVFIEVQNVDAPCCADGCIVDQDEPWIEDSYEECAEEQICNEGYCITKEELNRLKEEKRIEEENARKEQDKIMINGSSNAPTKIRPNVVVNLPSRKGGLSPILILSSSLIGLILIGAIVAVIIKMKNAQ